MSLKKWWKASVYLRKGVLGDNQKFLFWVQPFILVYISLLLCLFPFLLVDLFDTYTLELYVAQSVHS
jgi:hypothetical protein